MKNNILTIFRKECARFFGDKQLLFTTVLMPGLILYLCYSLMGSGVQSEIEKEMEEAVQPVALWVENMPDEIAPALEGLTYEAGRWDTTEVFAQIRNKENNLVYLTFGHKPGTTALQAHIYYNQNNSAASAMRSNLDVALNDWEQQQVNLIDINADEAMTYNIAAPDDEDNAGRDLLGGLLPMLILTMLYSACLAVVPSAIAGEKERGTIATLLVTPMRRSELAWGKIFSISLLALLSGCSSFLGIMLSLPKMAIDESLSFNIAPAEYAALFVVILSTVLLIVGCMSVLAALAKDVKNASTLVVPLMLVVMGVGFSTMFTDGAVEAWWAYLIPFFNSVQCMSAVFCGNVEWLPLSLTLLSNVALTLATVWLLSKMFNSERIMFSK